MVLGVFLLLSDAVFEQPIGKVSIKKMFICISQLIDLTFNFVRSRCAPFLYYVGSRNKE